MVPRPAYAMVGLVLGILLATAGCSPDTPLPERVSAAPAAVPRQAPAQTLPEDDEIAALDETLAEADTAIVGIVEAITAERAKNEFGDDVIYSDVDVRLDQLLKGQAAGTARFRMEGGVVQEPDGPLGLEVSESEVPRVGDRGAFLLRAGRALGRGVLLLDGDQVRGRSRLRLQDITARAGRGARGGP